MAVFAKLKSGWMSFVDVFGRVQTTLLLTLVYHLSIGPIALICKLMRKDLLQLRSPQGDSCAQPMSQVSSSLELAQRQF
jgi:hypothetical protein